MKMFYTIETKKKRKPYMKSYAYQKFTSSIAL